MGCRAVSCWNPATSSFPLCKSPVRSGTACRGRQQRLSFTVKTCLQLRVPDLRPNTFGLGKLILRADAQFHSMLLGWEAGNIGDTDKSFFGSWASVSLLQPNMCLVTGSSWGWSLLYWEISGNPEQVSVPRHYCALAGCNTGTMCQEKHLG